MFFSLSELTAIVIETGYLLATCPHVIYSFSHDAHDAAQRFRRISIEPGQAGEFGAQANMFLVFFRPRYTIRVVIRVHGDALKAS